jgi:hypothetical protein
LSKGIGSVTSPILKGVNMLRSVNNLIGCSIKALDGELGKVSEFYFDDLTWTIRYLVVNTGNWLSDRKVLIPHKALGITDWNSQTFLVNLTMKQVSDSPDIDTQKPVSRQHEEKLFEHYALPVYWGEGFYPTALGMVPLTPAGDLNNLEAEDHSKRPLHEDPDLRSTMMVKGYHIHAKDGEIGHVVDFIVDDTQWNLSFFIVDTHNWIQGRKVLIKPLWIDHIDCEESKVFVDLSRESIKNSPEFDSSQPVSKDYESVLLNYYKEQLNNHLVN